MNPPRLEATAQIGSLILGLLIVAVAWSLYQNPAMGLLLGSVRFCG